MAKSATHRPRSLKSRALQLLAQREQSRVELRRKLIAHAQREHAGAALAAADAIAADGPEPLLTPDEDSGGQGTASGPATYPRRADGVTDVRAIEEQVDAVLAWLESNRFMSDARFAESRVHARESRFGNLRIRHELAQHGVALSSEVERSLAESELQRARAVCARKFSVWPATAAERARAARFLAARGFSGDAVRQVLRSGAVDGTDD